MAKESPITAAITEESVIKALFTLGCCSWGVTIIRMPIASGAIYLPSPGPVLLAAVLAKAIMLSGQGKWSASWAIVAFGSLATALIHLLLQVIWDQAINRSNPWQDVLLYTLAIGIVICFGGKAALAGAWKRTVLFAVLASVLIIYSSHFCYIMIDR